MTDKPAKKYAEQIDKFVLGFVQLWDKFESTLTGELAMIPLTPGMKLDGSHSNANYELFYRVGSSISPRDNLTMGELSNALAVPLSTATRIVDYLVERKYIIRLPDSEDRRVVRVALTPMGKELHQTIDNHVKQRVEQILSCLDVEERQQLFASMGKIISAMRKETA
jgi:DNA-binding MarR family transcriptional regulator